jgi:hypothetical protein
MKKYFISLLLMLFATMALPLACTADCIEGDCKNGAGSYVWDSGNKYQGIFKNGKRTGQGTYTFANGDKFVGEFLDGKFHGKGKYTYTDGDVYDGQWLLGRMSGHGVLKRADGTKQEGEFKDGAYVEKWNMNTDEVIEPDANKYPRGHLEKLMDEPSTDKSTKKPSKK